MLRQERLHSTYIRIVNHDQSRAFNVLYISLALILSVFVSLFWLVLIVGIHFTLELIRQHHYCSESIRKVFGRSFWQLKLDLSFIAFSFAVDAYMGVLLGVAGLGNISSLRGIEEAEISSGARLGGYERAIRGVMLSSDDIARTTTAAIGFKNDARDNRSDTLSESDDAVKDDVATLGMHDSEQPMVQELAPKDANLQVRWSRKDYATVAFGITCICLLFLTPWLIGMTYDELLQIIMKELQPFPW
jgi:hypothetical protein